MFLGGKTSVFKLRVSLALFSYCKIAWTDVLPNTSLVVVP